MFDAKKIFVQEMYPQLLLVNEKVAEVFGIVATSDVFLLTKANNYTLSYEGITEVAQFQIRNENYSLLRKVYIIIQLILS